MAAPPGEALAADSGEDSGVMTERMDSAKKWIPASARATSRRRVSARAARPEEAARVAEECSEEEDAATAEEDAAEVADEAALTNLRILRRTTCIKSYGSRITF